MYSGYRARREVFRDSDVVGIRCPECGEICEDTRRWVSERNDRYITLATCPEHGRYIARLTIEKTKEIYNASKIIYTAGGGAELFYEKRAKKEGARKKRRKKKVKSAAPRKKTITVEKV